MLSFLPGAKTHRKWYCLLLVGGIPFFIFGMVRGIQTGSDLVILIPLWLVFVAMFSHRAYRFLPTLWSGDSHIRYKKEEAEVSPSSTQVDTPNG